VKSENQCQYYDSAVHYEHVLSVFPYTVVKLGFKGLVLEIVKAVM